MSDDEKDIDVESEEDDYDDVGRSGVASPGTVGAEQFMTQAEKRAHHNALERKRRDHIKESFHSLRDAVPVVHGEKVSRAQILKKAAEYISFMRRKNNAHQHDIDDIKKQNYQLECEIRTLEKNKATSQYSGSVSTSLNPKGDIISAFDGGSGSESSDEIVTDNARQHKKLKVS